MIILLAVIMITGFSVKISAENKSCEKQATVVVFKESKSIISNWAGIEFGFNNYVTEEMNTVMPSDIYYMTLHSSKSSSFNLNFAQQSFGFTHYIGLVTGLGINWNNYRFDNNNNIRKGDNGVIEELNPLAALDKSKLTTVYMTVPLMLEFHVPANHHHLNIGAGVHS